MNSIFDTRRHQIDNIAEANKFDWSGRMSISICRTSQSISAISGVIMCVDTMNWDWVLL